MDPQLSKQLIAGPLIGLLMAGGAWYSLGFKREELAEMKEINILLEAEVAKGRQLKASYEVLKKEVEEQEERIAELVKLFPLESERARVTQMVQRLASNAGLGRMQDQRNSNTPTKKEYYSEWETTYRYTGGFHEYGEFLSLVSGYEKIINISEIEMTRNTARNAAMPVTIGFRLSVYVYESSTPARRPAGSGG